MLITHITQDGKVGVNFKPVDVCDSRSWVLALTLDFVPGRIFR